MNWMLAGFLVMGFLLSAEPKSDDVPQPFIIHNANTIKVDKRDPRDCSTCVGSEFKACMRSLSKEDFIANLRTLHHRACTAYVQQLKRKEIIEIRKLFTLQEWHALPEIFTKAMYEQFQIKQQKAQDAWWDRMRTLFMQLNVLAHD